MAGLESSSSGVLEFIWSLDILAKQWAHNIQNPWLTRIMVFITYMGASLTYLTISALVSIYLLSRRKELKAVFLNISLFTAWILVEFIKVWIGRLRPLGEPLTVATGYSFPSGHAMMSMAFYGFLAGLLLCPGKSQWHRLGGVSLYGLVLLIGFSRIYLNVHYLSDVLIGWGLGLLCQLASFKVMRKIQSR